VRQHRDVGRVLVWEQWVPDGWVDRTRELLWITMNPPHGDADPVSEEQAEEFIERMGVSP
jgi:hypothetical protein